MFLLGLQGKPWLIFPWQTRDFFLPGTCEPMRYSLSWKQVTHRVVTIAHVWYSWHENECVSSANHCISVSGIVGTWLPKPWPVARCAEDVPGQVPYRLSTGWQFWRSLRLQRIPGAVKFLLDRCIQLASTHKKRSTGFCSGWCLTTRERARPTRLMTICSSQSSQSKAVSSTR